MTYATSGLATSDMILAMIVWLRHVLGRVVGAFRSREDIILENLALRQQLLALHAQSPRRRLTASHKLFWVVLRRCWARKARPRLVLMNHRRGNPFLARRVELFHSFPRRSCDRRPPSRSSLPFIESKVFSEKTGRRLVLTSHSTAPGAFWIVARHTVRRLPRCEVNHRRFDWASRSLRRMSEVVIMIDVATGEMVGSD